MKENSREEDIKDLKKYISFSKKHENFSHDADWKWHKEIGEKIERVLKENEELLEVKVSASAHNRILELEKENEELKRLHIQDNKHLDFIMEHSIPVQKVKDKIDEILNNGEYRIIFEGDAEFPDEATIINAQRYIKLEKLQELLEGRK